MKTTYGTKPKVSVLTPVYKTNPEHLRACIESILAQSFQDFEFILLDDCPEDKECEKIIKSYNDKRIKYYRNSQNLGISRSRNKLIDLSQGEYLAVVDHDDVSRPYRFEKEVKILDKNSRIGVVSGWFSLICTEGNPIVKKPKYNINKKLLSGCEVVHPCAMIRKSILIENNVKYEEAFSPAEDFMLWIRLRDKTKFYNIQDVLLDYRNHNENTSTLKAKQMEEKTSEIFRIAKEKKSCPEIKLKLFKFFPIVNIKQKNRQTKEITFFKLPLIKIKQRNDNTVMVYFLGLGILKISKKNISYKDSLPYKINLLEGHVNNLMYEIADEFNLKGKNITLPKIMSIEETIDEIINKKLSISRFGDGEFRMMFGEDNLDRWYFGTKSDYTMQEKLIETIKNPNKNLLVCLWGFMGSLEYYTPYGKENALQYMPYFRERLGKYLIKNVYGNAFISRPYMAFKDKKQSEVLFNKIKKIWENRDIVIIEGEFTKFGVENDLLSNAASVKRVICPCENAWSKYKNIKKFCMTLPKDKLILLALGMTATILSADLAEAGYQAIDIGHLDIEYDWFLNNCQFPQIIKGKYTNDAVIKGGLRRDDIPLYKISAYNEQIIKIIKIE